MAESLHIAEEPVQNSPRKGPASETEPAEAVVTDAGQA
jgi:hypothetical protein